MSAEREHISFCAGIEKFDLEQTIRNGLRLPNELIEPLFHDGAIALLVDVGAMGLPRRTSIEENAEAYR